jgi:rhamnosyltransferase subunit B
MPISSAVGQFTGTRDARPSLAGTERRRVLLLPLGTWGDVLPFARLGRELRRRGHAVSMLACELFEPLARREGFEFLPLLDRDEYQRIFANPRLWHPRWAGITFLRDAVLPFMRRQYDVADHFCRAGECDVLVAPSQSLGARIAQEKLSVPLVTVHLAPYMFRSAIASRKVSGVSLPVWLPPAMKRAMFRLADFCGDLSFGREVNKFRAELGLPRVRRVFWEWWNSPERIVALFPEWFAEPQADWPRRTVMAGFLPVDDARMISLDAGLESFLQSGSEPIVFTAGTAMAHGGRFFENSILTARALGKRAILLSQFRGQIPDDLPPGVIARDFVPLTALLQRAAAIVHHGGIGTSAQGIAAGVPQLLVPMSFDQPDNAHRVECLGVGRSIDWRSYSKELAVPALDALIHDAAIQRRCREVALWCGGTDAVRIACDQIEAAALVTEVTSPKRG